MILTFLGTGTSTGVPQLGCNCPVCKSPHRYNNRTRASALLELPGGKILIDTPPDLRAQLLREGVERIDAVLLTHYHADHIFGLDDLRVFPKLLGYALPVYCERSVLAVLQRAYPYVFDPRSSDIPAGAIPKLDLRIIGARRPFEVLGQQGVPIRLLHGRFRVLGFRFGNLAYLTDVSRIPRGSMQLLTGLEVLVLDALRDRPHPTHLSLEESLAVVEQLRPRRTYFTHISHELDHLTTNARLPPEVELAYDGLRVECH